MWLRIIPVLFAVIVTLGCDTDGDSMPAPASPAPQSISDNAAMTEYIALHTCNLGNETRTGTNPFSGESVEFPIDKGLTESERDAIKLLLQQHNASEPSPEGFYCIEFEGDSYMNVGAAALETEHPCISFKLELCGPVTSKMLDFSRQLALAGNMTVGSIFDPGKVALVTDSDDPLIAKRWPNSPTLRTADEFNTWVQTELEIKVAK